jgi:steroid delta-isomerase-like uncharacterized protein
MTSYAFAVEWLKAYRRDPHEVAALYADDFIFNSPTLDLFLAADKAALIRAFAIYANADKDNGVGIHNIRVRSFQGDSRSGLIRWEWSPQHADAFLGLDVTGKPFATQGRSFQIYDENGKIKYESAWWDATGCLTGIGYGDVRKHILSPTTAPA